jgi:hypothetical protein
MGALLGGIIGEVIEGVADATRESIAAAMRAAADKIERGDIVPDEALELAKKDQSRLDAIRARKRRESGG